ncbi:MAG: hypothetical protein JJU28_09705 [Cyclobacteriaceae bacterium]|nr:hypothetical protein [Cyclobacteriaceae bacterium]
MKRILLWLSLIAVVACSGKKSSEDALIASLDSLKLNQPLISKEVMADIIQQIPSPLEISFLLKSSGVKYDFDMLNNPNNISKYNSSFEKALNLGIYGTDLGYANIYEQNQDALFYLNAIKSLADDLSIGQFFDFGTIRRLAVNSRNLDSLLLITTQNFNNINTFLQENQRSNLSVLILTGGWLEALHITCQVAVKDPDNEQLIEKIGEQKIILDNIKLLLGFYVNDPFIADLHKQILELEKAFSEIEIIYKYAEPTFQEVNGMLVIKDNSTTTINITPQNVEDIRKGVASIRSKVIS